MASAGQQLKQRVYDYKPSNFSTILSDIHTYLTNKFKAPEDAINAQKLQNFLQTIKNTARYLNEQREDFSGTKTILDKAILGSGEALEWYTNLIDETISIQNQARAKNGLSNQLGKYSLFRRTHKGTKSITDDIFEEELAALFTAIGKRTDKTYNMDSFMMGNVPMHIAGGKELIGDIEQGVLDWAKDYALKEEHHTYALGQVLTYEKSGKPDINGLHLTGTLTTNDAFLQEVVGLLQDATFTVKNYSSIRHGKGGLTQALGFNDLNLQLGKTNLMKSIIAIFNTVYSGEYVNVQRDKFYRGLQILRYTKKQPSAAPNMVATHYTHMRFVYELTGLGLLDQNNNLIFAKYLIYNDPTSENIFVRDTAGLILEELNSNSAVSNVFGRMELKASRVRS